MTWFALGATVAGALTGALAGTLGRALLPGAAGSDARFGVLALGLAAAGLLDARGTTAPGPRRQVNERWLDEFRGWVYGLGFGTQLGVGLSTVVSSAATYVALLAALLSGSPAGGAVIVGGYGALRGLTPVLSARVRTPAQLRSLHARLERWEEPGRWLGVGALATGTVAAAIGWLT